MTRPFSTHCMSKEGPRLHVIVLKFGRNLDEYKPETKFSFFDSLIHLHSSTAREMQHTIRSLTNPNLHDIPASLYEFYAQEMDAPDTHSIG